MERLHDLGDGNVVDDDAPRGEPEGDYDQAKSDADIEAILKGDGNNEAPHDPDQDPGHPDVAGQPAPA